MNYAVFNSEAETDAYRAQAIIDSNAAHECEMLDGCDYLEQTTHWGTARQRVTDGKWVVNLCEYSDNTGIASEEYSADWFPEDEE